MPPRGKSFPHDRRSLTSLPALETRNGPPRHQLQLGGVRVAVALLLSPQPSLSAMLAHLSYALLFGALLHLASAQNCPAMGQPQAFLSDSPFLC